MRMDHRFGSPQPFTAPKIFANATFGLIEAYVSRWGGVGHAIGRINNRRWLWRLASDHSLWSRPAGNRRRCEDREISVAALEAIAADLAVSNSCKLTPQKTWRGTMLGRRPVSVDNADARARLECRDEVVEQAVGLGDRYM
jgi:hypothetical protein